MSKFLRVRFDESRPRKFWPAKRLDRWQHRLLAGAGPLRFLLLLMLPIALAGCTDPQRAPLVGTWVLAKPESVLTRIDGSQDERDGAGPTTETDSSVASTSLPRMTIRFDSNGAFETQTAMGAVNRQKNGAWEVISFDESARKMTIRCTIGVEQTDHEVELSDDGTIRLVPPNLAGLTMTMRFQRP